MDQYIECPKCKNSSTADFWDRATKAEAGVKPEDKYISVSDTADNHAEYQTYYHCPLCNEEVDGTELVKK